MASAAAARAGRGADAWRGLVSAPALLALLLLAADAEYQEDPLRGEAPDGHGYNLLGLRPIERSNDSQAPGCELPARSGRLSGVCQNTSDELRNSLPFCGNVVTYRTCVPADQPLWPSWTVEMKDTQLAMLFKDVVEDRLAKELNSSEEVYVPIRFMSNPDCINALKNVLCWYNFPKCSDENVSLSLCRSSCEEYYRACKYEANETDGLFDACRQETVASTGLFESNLSGPDMRLAEDTKVCRSTEALVDTMTEAEQSAPPWVLTTQGFSILGSCAFIVFSAAFYLLVPDGLKAYAWWYVSGIFMKPVYLWRRIPYLRGTTVLLFFFLVLLVFLIWAIIRRSSSGATWFKERGFKPEEMVSGAKDKVGWAADQVTARAAGLKDRAEDRLFSFMNNYTVRNFSYNASGDFIPQQSIYGLQTVQGLTFKQKRQLIGSCTCTGG